jgi:hypothetical protein
MKARFGLLLFLILAIAPAIAQNTDTIPNFDGNDIIALSDGSILVGTIKERTSNSIRFQDKTIGETLFRRTDMRWEMHAETGVVYRVTTTSGSNYVGKLTAATGKGLMLETSIAGKVAIPFESIRNVERIGKSSITKQANLPVTAQSEFVLYHTLPSAIPLNRDEFYYRNVAIFINSVGYGVNDHLTVGGGVVGFIIPYIRANAGWEISPNNYVGGGVFASAGFFGLGFGGVGGFATYTRGTPERHISASLGYGAFIADGFVEMPESPMINLSGLIKVGRRAVIVSENWIVPRVPQYTYTPTGYIKSFDTYSAHSIIMRVMGNNRTWEFGVMSSPQLTQNNVLFLPYIGYMFRF